MKKITKYTAAVALLCGVSTAAFAQDNKEDFKPYWFVGVQGGAQTTFTNYNSLKLVTPQFALQFGRWFAPEFGARLHLMGYDQKGGIAEGQYGLNKQTYKFKACTADIDFLFNMSNILSPARNCKNFNWILLAGFGSNYSWDYDEFKTLTYNNDFQSRYPNYHEQVCGTKHSTFNGRLGTIFEYDVTNSLSLNLELQANYKNDLYNLKVNDKNDWQAAALIGVTFKIGKAKKAPVQEVEPIYETRIDTVWYNDTSYKTVETEASLRRDLHFAIRKNDPISQQTVSEIVNFVKNNKDVKITVTGYADKGTGNNRVNMKYSKNRAEALTKALVDAGVPAEIITTEWKGDSVQPFANNDDNRATITVASGIGEKKEEVVTKKYRLEEKKVRVN